MTAASQMRARRSGLAVVATPEPGVVLCDIYLRLSDGRIEEALDGREAKLRAEAARRGWTVRRVVRENDVDDQGRLLPASAFKRRKIKTPSGRVELRVIRDGYRSIIEALTAGTIQAMLTEDLDRTVRDPRDLEDLIDAVAAHAGTAASLTGSLTLTEGGTGGEIDMARVMVTMANKSSRDTSRRVAEKRGVLAGQSYGGGRRPFGYEPDPDRSRKYHRILRQRPAEAAEITRHYDDVLADRISLRAWARELREARVPTVTGKAAWSAEILRDVLIKPSLAGLAWKDGELVEAEFIPEPIVTRQQWDAMVEKMTDPARRTNSTANEPRWLLSSWSVCGVCGATVKIQGGTDRSPSYQCSAGQHVRRKATDLDRYIEGWVVGLLERDDDGTMLAPPPAPEVDVPAIQAELRRIARSRREAEELREADLISKGELFARMRRYRDQEAAAKAKLAVSNAPDPLPEFRPGARGQATARQVWEALDMPRKRAVVQALLTSVTINRAGGRGPIDAAVEVLPVPELRQAA